MGKEKTDRCSVRTYCTGESCCIMKNMSNATPSSTSRWRQIGCKAKQANWLQGLLYARARRSPSHGSSAIGNAAPPWTVESFERRRHHARISVEYCFPACVIMYWRGAQVGGRRLRSSPHGRGAQVGSRRLRSSPHLRGAQVGGRRLRSSPHGRGAQVGSRAQRNDSPPRRRRIAN